MYEHHGNNVHNLLTTLYRKRTPSSSPGLTVAVNVAKRALGQKNDRRQPPRLNVPLGSRAEKAAPALTTAAPAAAPTLRLLMVQTTTVSGMDVLLSTECVPKYIFRVSCRPVGTWARYQPCEYRNPQFSCLGLCPLNFDSVQFLPELQKYSMIDMTSGVSVRRVSSHAEQTLACQTPCTLHAQRSGTILLSCDAVQATGAFQPPSRSQPGDRAALGGCSCVLWAEAWPQQHRKRTNEPKYSCGLCATQIVS